nr:ATP-binding protein [Mariniphaga anaerophila]
MELLKLKNELEAKVALRTKELQEKVVKLDKSQKAMLFMVEDLSNITVELKKERKKLEFSNKELEAFAYSVSHDLRAPLRAINGYSNFLLEDYAKLLDDEGKRFINTIRENATKMDQLISDMLNLSRVSRASLNLSEVNMASIVKSIYNETANEKEKKQFEFCLNEIPDAVCDYSLIKQVWQNLISNALKYSSKSAEKKIEIGAEKSNNEVIYYIKDKGAGFDSKYENKLFGVFQRLHKSSEFKGTGVGLAIVQRIVVRHEGRIWAESEVDKGAVFFFSLPDK